MRITPHRSTSHFSHLFPTPSMIQADTAYYVLCPLSYTQRVCSLWNPSPLSYSMCLTITPYLMHAPTYSFPHSYQARMTYKLVICDIVYCQKFSVWPCSDQPSPSQSPSLPTTSLHPHQPTLPHSPLPTSTPHTHQPTTPQSSRLYPPTSGTNASNL